MRSRSTGYSTVLHATLAALLISGALFAVWLIPNVWTSVDPGEVKVGVLFGKPKPDVYTEGFHFVNPLLTMRTFSILDETLEFTEVPLPSQDKLYSTADVSVIWDMSPSSAPVWLREYGLREDFSRTQLIPRFRSMVREMGKQVPTSQDWFQESIQNQFQTEVQAKLNEQLAGTGAEVKAVLLRQIRLPAVVNTAIIATKERQEQVERERAQLLLVEQQAQQDVKRAEAERDAAVAQAEARRTLADATAYQILTEATAQAKANEALSKSISPVLVQYNLAAKWDGQYPRMMTGDGTGILLSMKE